MCVGACAGDSVHVCAHVRMCALCAQVTVPPKETIAEKQEKIRSRGMRMKIDAVVELARISQQVRERARGARRDRPVFVGAMRACLRGGKGRQRAHICCMVCRVARRNRRRCSFSRRLTGTSPMLSTWQGVCMCV